MLYKYVKACLFFQMSQGSLCICVGLRFFSEEEGHVLFFTHVKNGCQEWTDGEQTTVVWLPTATRQQLPSGPKTTAAFNGVPI